MENAGGNIKVMSIFLFILEIITGIVWFVIVLFQYFSGPRIHGSEITSVLSIFLIPVCIILGSLVTYFLMYGFGQLVENSDIMVDHQRIRFENTEPQDNPHIDDEFKEMQIGDSSYK